MSLVLAVFAWAVAGAAAAMFSGDALITVLDGRRRKVADELAEVKRAARPPVHEGNIFYLQVFFSAAGFVVFYLATASIPFSVIFSFSGAILPIMYVRYWKQKRMEALEKQMPEVLRALASAMRAGRSFQLAVESVSSVFEEPARSELALISIQMKLGAHPEEALKEGAKRAGGEDMLLFAAAVEAARRAGGNLAAVMEKLAGTVEDRLRVKLKVKTLAAQGRAQGWIMGMLPVGMLCILYVLDRNMLAGVFSHPLGIALMALAGIFEVAGVVIMRRMLKLEV